jgi:hypothetical protein
MHSFLRKDQWAKVTYFRITTTKASLYCNDSFLSEKKWQLNISSPS